jgi:hypothetical protein
MLANSYCDLADSLLVEWHGGDSIGKLRQVRTCSVFEKGN